MKIIDALINAIKNPDTYKELIYLLLAMPLGILYFVVLMTGLSLGGSLLIIGIGFVIIAAVLILARLGGHFEALLARTLLNADIEPALDLHYDRNQTMLANAGRILTDGKTVRSVVFLALKFPFGIMTFILTILALALPLGLIGAPFIYNETNITIGTRAIDTSFEAFVAMLFGIVLLPLSLVALKAMANGWRALAEAILQPVDTSEKQKRKLKREAAYFMDESLLLDDEYLEDDEDYEADADSLRRLLTS